MVVAEKATVRKTTIKLKFRWTKFVRFVLFLALAVFIFEISWTMMANLLQKVVVAEWGGIEKGIWMEVLYLREEKLVTAPTAGWLTPMVKTGDRIPNDEILALLDTRERRNEAGSVISASGLQRYKQYQKLSQEETALRFDLQRIETDLANHLSHSQIQGTLTDLASLEQEKERVMRTIQWIHPQMVQIRQELGRDLNHTRFVAASEAGYFSRETDGYETMMQPETFEQLTLSDFRKRYSLKKTANHVKAGEVIGKIINPFKQIMAVKINRSQSGIPNPGTVWRFKTESGWKNAAVVCLKNFNAKQAIAGFEIPSPNGELVIPRTEKMFVVYQKITGITIPVQAIFRKRHQAFVRVVKGNCYRVKPVQVLDDDGSKAVVSGIDVGTMIISR